MFSQHFFWEPKTFREESDWTKGSSGDAERETKTDERLRRISDSFSRLVHLGEFREKRKCSRVWTEI